MKSTADPRPLLDRFWSELTKVRTGMLGLATERHGHAQPMTAHFEGVDGPIWFFARRDSELVQGAQGAQPASFHYAGGGHDLFACVHGELSAVADPDTAARFWSEEVARWFPGGPDDPDLALLRFELEKAHIWLPRDAADASTFGFKRGSPDDVRAEARL